MKVICSRRALFAAIAPALAGLTSAAPGTATVGTDSARGDDSAPQRFAPPGALMPPIATHSSEIQYLFDQPNTPVPATLDADQERLAATMRTAWARFAASGNPSTRAMPWRSFNAGSDVLSLESPQPRLDSSFA